MTQPTSSKPGSGTGDSDSRQSASTGGDHVNIASHLTRMAQALPENAALILSNGREKRTPENPRGRRYRRITFAELDAESDRYAHGLTAAGLGRGVKVALLLRPGAEFFALVFALFKAGAVQVMIDPGMGLRNMLRCLEEIEPQGLIGIPAAIALKKLTFSLPSVRTTVTAGRRWFWGGPRLSDLRSANTERFPIADTRRDENAAVLFTSGSTGLAKGVVYQHGMFDAQVAALRSQYGIAPDEVDLATFPPFALFDPAMGMTAVIPEMDFRKPGSVFPPNILDLIQDHNVTHMFGSPALLDRVSRYGESLNIRLPSLRRVISAGAPVPPPVLKRVSTMLSPGVEIHTPYGATESLPVATISSSEILNDTRHATANGHGTCVGRPVGDIRVRIIGITDAPIETWSEDLALPIGQPGEIVVQGPVVTKEYAARPEATQLAKIADPDPAVSGYGWWHRMGDIGCFDQQGRLWFYGRKTHRVQGLLNGKPHTWFTDPCEGILNAKLGVPVRTALVGIPDPASAAKGLDHKLPVMLVEKIAQRGTRSVFSSELKSTFAKLAAEHEALRGVTRIVEYPGEFPVDIRHNSKIFREKLAVWAEGQPIFGRSGS